MGRTRTRSGWLLTVGALTSAACAGGDTTVSSVTVRDSAGVTIVESHAPAWGGAGWTVTADPEVRIGSTDGTDPATLFSYVQAMGRLSDGRTVVVDAETGEVRWFAVDGRHLHTAGGRGQGPGEFNYPLHMLVLPGDTVLVEDRPRIRHLFFGPDGEWVRTETFEVERMRELGLWAECTDLLLPDRSRLVCAYLPGEGPVADPGPGLYRRFTRYVRVPWDLSRQDTLGLYGGIEQFGVRNGDRTRFAVHPFHARTQVAVGRDPLRVAIAVNPAYSIEVWRGDGALEHIVRRPGGRRAATPELRSAADESFDIFANDDQALAARFRAEVPVPDSLPAVTALSVGSGGELWVRRSLFREPGPWIHDVFDAQGRFLGSVELPQRFTIHEVGPDWILGLRTDELDVPFVEVYGLDRGR